MKIISLHEETIETSEEPISNTPLSTSSSNHKLILIQLIKNTIFIALGVISTGFGLKGFLLPNGFIDGGVTGISLLLKELTDYTFSMLIIAVNIPFIVLGYFQINRTFVIKSIVAIIGLAIVLEPKGNRQPENMGYM